MTTFVILLRGINVGGKNKIPMSELKSFLEEQGFAGVVTYIQSGNLLLQSNLEAKMISQQIEEGLPRRFKLDSSIIKVLTLTHEQLRAVVDNKPKGFGDQPDTYHSDVIFLLGISADEAMKIFKPRDGVDVVWPGNGVIYSQRLSALRTKSRLSAIMASPLYKSMTIRNWNTVTRLLQITSKLP